MNWKPKKDALSADLPNAKHVLESELPQGTLVFAEANQPQTPIAAIFPGYTGNAWTHEAFIKAAIAEGISCVSVTPNWASTTYDIQQNVKALLAQLNAVPELWNRIRFIRGVSYGAQLSLNLLKEIPTQIEKIAWVTPCSDRQISQAAKLMNLSLTDNSQSPETMPSCKSSIRIISLQSDTIVPHTDAQFLKISQSTETMSITHHDHFTAGDTAEGALNIALWFGGKNGRA